MTKIYAYQWNGGSSDGVVTWSTLTPLERQQAGFKQENFLGYIEVRSSAEGDEHPNHTPS